ncbi:dTDP-4-dehydrorhamnose 3,5-epimerase [Methylocella silvestris BL2]|uniref:dTDP-4-dehydrorhamnose 3,5-epimerase n=1 Tax=Methylocella silvestris (strain DSM 15510 / CIP 108128 / LMG 27833 / NCIMB 13906 / BL2) TaxID=395965 RepID=B8ERT4_METSB|nr:dTDP-4-dehydrorhamnose 3,5-epimerase [Methylocella silvestris]ACK51632.1 dTDP-4-dehydrorhamnose 3,5-epimerase [Methylocella silvestris BL2]
MDVKTTDLPGVLVLKPRRFADQRGYFVETYNRRTFAKAGVDAQFVQDNQSFSAKAGTIRGLHFQLPPAAQAKLVRAVRGAIFDVAVDLRAGSPTFGRWIGETLTAGGGEQLLIPRGFAHAFCTLEDDVEVAYKVDDFYAPTCDSGLIWNDPDLKIEWPVEASAAVLSDKDAKLGRFADFVSPFRFEAGAP